MPSECDGRPKLSEDSFEATVIATVIACYGRPKLSEDSFEATLTIGTDCHCDCMLSEDSFEATLRTVVQIHLCEGEGDILVFLTGEQEIEDACKKTKSEIEALGDQVPDVVIFPLYSTPLTTAPPLSHRCPTSSYSLSTLLYLWIVNAPSSTRRRRRVSLEGRPGVRSSSRRTSPRPPSPSTGSCMSSTLALPSKRCAHDCSIRVHLSASECFLSAF